ncbi:MAG: pyridoxamine 5'-phosphate oxidase family protein [Bryobacteraceae bacterium]|nr:pyridoxamine 5'-phosphate oxidase family protein [Bryobacteraceae bacterium]
MTSELDRFYELIEDIEIAMMTTRRPKGHLRSRPMANQERALGADLWFVTLADSAKLEDIAHDRHVNLAYFKRDTMEWISVSGLAETTTDRVKIAELYADDWKMWFPDSGDPRDGTKDDPRMTLIGVTIHTAEFLRIDKPKPVILYELAKGWITGSQPQIGDVKQIVEPRRTGM